MGATGRLFAGSSFLRSGAGCPDAVEQTWGNASEQIRAVVDSVVFPALSMVLVIEFFVKLALTYFEYRKHGQFEWTGPAILFVCRFFILLGPNYIWGIIGG